MPLTIRKLEEHIGAEVQGVDITSHRLMLTHLNDFAARFVKYAVLVFHDQGHHRRTACHVQRRVWSARNDNGK